MHNPPRYSSGYVQGARPRSSADGRRACAQDKQALPDRLRMADREEPGVQSHDVFALPSRILLALSATVQASGERRHL